MDKGITEIIGVVRTKQKIMGEVLALTKEIQEAFQNNDAQAAELALDMRMEKILEAQECDERIEAIFDFMRIDQALRITKIMRLQCGRMELTLHEKVLFDLYSNMKSIVDRSIEIDKEISKRIGGRQSIYMQKFTDIK